MSVALVTLPDGKQARITFDSPEQLDATVTSLSQEHPAPKRDPNHRLQSFDLDSRGTIAGPTGSPAALSQRSKFDSGGPGAMDIIGAAVEPAMSMATGAVAQPLSGLAGLGAAGTNALGITSTPPADVVGKVQDTLSYQPRTQGGKDAMSVLGLPGDLVHRGANALADPLAQHGYPGLATLLDTNLEASAQLLGGMGGKGVAKTPGVLKPTEMRPSAKMLSDKGIAVTPGQARGGFVNTMEQKIAQVDPYVIGPVFKNARGRSVEEFSKLTFQDALTDIGEKLPGDLKGHDAVKYTSNKLSAKYDELLSKMSGDLTAGPKPFIGELAGIKQMAQNSTMSRRAKRIVLDTIDAEVIEKFDQAGKAKGETLQDIHEKLRVNIDHLMKSDDLYERQAALALVGVKEALDKMMEQQNPKYAKSYQDLRAAYAKYKIAETAAGALNAKEGVATPFQYLSAVQRETKKSDFAKGKGLQQPLAEAGRDALAFSEPNSGSPAGNLLLNLGAAGSAIMHNPIPFIGAAVIPLLYSKVGIQALQPFLRGEKKFAPSAGAVLGLGSALPPMGEQQAPEPDLSLDLGP